MYMQYRSFGFSHYVATWGCENHFQIAYLDAPVWWYPGSRYGYTLQRLKDLLKGIRHGRHDTWFSSTKRENATSWASYWSNLEHGCYTGWPWAASSHPEETCPSLNTNPRRLTYLRRTKRMPSQKESNLPTTMCNFHVSSRECGCDCSLVAVRLFTVAHLHVDHCSAKLPRLLWTHIHKPFEAQALQDRVEF